jgi:hypothetical protein
MTVISVEFVLITCDKVIFKSLKIMMHLERSTEWYMISEDGINETTVLSCNFK